MFPFVEYQVKVAVILAAFYFVYRLLMGRETFHRVNRVMLLAVPVLVAVLPLFFHLHRGGAPLDVVADIVCRRREESVVLSRHIVMQANPFSMYYIPFYLYCIGAVVVMVRVVCSYRSVMRIIHRGGVVERGKRWTVVCTGDDNMSPFNWMRYVVVSRKDIGRKAVLDHEKAHASFRHSVDVLLMDIYAIVQWFNPVIWQMRADLRTLHEYEADTAVLKGGTDVREYQYMLIKTVAERCGYDITSGLGGSELRNRIRMMSCRRSRPVKLLSYTLIIPLVALAVYVNASRVQSCPRNPIVFAGGEVGNFYDFVFGEMRGKSVIVLESWEAVRVFGEKGREGAVLIDTPLPEGCHFNWLPEQSIK